MDHLDLAEVLSTPWLPPCGQNGDSSYVIRAALEPIIEETSDDDENGIVDQWTEMEHAAWSSESETGSVIRVEIHQDQDTISERDFACPAKRRRQDEFNDDLFQLRLKPRQDLEFKFKVECCDNLDNFGKRCRLDDYSDIYSDSDSISFNSLSRSSSLIQFESLERQLQVDSQPYGGSTPALHPQACYVSTEITKSKRFETSSRNYYDVNKIDFNKFGDFNKTEFLTGGQQNELKRTDGSNSDSDNSDVMSIKSQPAIEIPKRINYRGGKNSVETLSEDSGYCEYNLLRIRSKSIPNFGHDDFIEEEEFENHKSLENMLYSIRKAADETHSMNIDINSRVISENNSTKIETTKRYSAVHSSTNDAKNTIDGHCIGGIASQNISTSLPDILNHIGVDGEENNSSDQIDGQYHNLKPKKSDQFLHFSIVSSVPNDLNICNDLSATDNATYCSAAAKNFDLCDFETTYVPVESYRQHKVINASYSNLTVLDYSGRQSFSSSIGSLKKMADNRKRSSGEFSKCNFLLDEISAHFNRDLSILNDRTENYDPVVDNFLYAERIDATPPIPPPRKTQPTNKSNNKHIDLSSNVQHIGTEPSPTPIHDQQQKLTFDRDPTNLVTCYAESMERCNFDARGSSYSINSNSNLDATITPSKHSTAVKRQMVASTPNLCLHNVDDADDYFDISTTAMSMNPLPNVQQELHDKKQGILSVGSRNSLGKGVSFCPIVSEISWREQSSDECVDDEEFNISDEQTDHNISSTSLENSRTIQHRSEVVTTERDNTCTPHVNNQDRGTTAEGNKKTLPSSLNPKVSSNVMIVSESVPLMNGDNRSVIKLSEQRKDIKRTMETGSSDCNNSKPTKSHLFGADGNDNKNLAPVKPEKKHKSGFLSRISGFRFSLRGKKKAKVFENNNPVINEHRVTSDKHDKNEKIEKFDNNHSSINKNSDFVFIPLKVEPLSGNANSSPERCVKSKQNSDVVNNSHVLTAKPPLPRQPPRVVGLCAKPPLPNGKPKQVHAQQRASSAPREIDVNDHHLSSDHEFYNQFYSETMTSIGDDSGNCDDDRFNESYGFEHKIGLIETNLDTDETVISGKTRSLMELGPQMDNQRKQCSAKHRIVTAMEPQTRRPHKSMEFLLDKENQKFVLPPENELQKCHDNNPVLSEHQLRVQASLQRLNIPEWYRKYGPPSKPTESSQSGYVPGSFTKKRNSDVGRWTGLNSKTTSLSSLGSNRAERSPLLLSPSAHSHHGQTGFSRWSTSHLNSSLTSPSASTRGSFSRGGVLNSSTLSGASAYSARSSIRQPYLGWRSQEKLDNPRTPGERLAARHSEHLLGRQLSKQRKQNDQQEPAVTPEIQSSIKEVTSAIVHFVNDQADRTSRSRSTSPTARKCWLESSFVGNRPLDSPQTPVIDTFSPRGSTDATMSRLNGVATPIPVLTVHSSDRPSPSSTTLEDVLASLLGLPTDSYRSSSDITLANDTTEAKTHLQIETVPPRRRSEGDAQKRADSTNSLRRGSLDSNEFKNDNELVKCRYPKCDSSTTAVEAKKYYKSCHNCSHMYCSRECRRSHWEKHRKACLHSRVSALCRQVLSACKDDADTLRHLSLLARKGYVSVGRGVIRILFRSPESAEAFVTKGFQCIGEACYVRWPELLPQEMGPELYSELLRLSTEYKTDSKMLIYVAICVVSETPGSGAAPVKWERQLVSRCAKLKLSKAVPSEMAMPNVQSEQNSDILILTFCTVKKNNQKVRELIMVNIQNILKRRGVSIRKHFPEIHQRLNSFVEGTTDKFLPVTIHPRDSVTGRAFICIIMANNGEADKIKVPTNGTNNVQIIPDLESVEWN